MYINRSEVTLTTAASGGAAKTGKFYVTWG